jgi:hypothetical protein
LSGNVALAGTAALSVIQPSRGKFVYQLSDQDQLPSIAPHPVPETVETA